MDSDFSVLQVTQVVFTSCEGALQRQKPASDPPSCEDEDSVPFILSRVLGLSEFYSEQNRCVSQLEKTIAARGVMFRVP